MPISESRKQMASDFMQARVMHDLLKKSTVIKNSEGKEFRMLTENEYRSIGESVADSIREYLEYDFDEFR